MKEDGVTYVPPSADSTGPYVPTTQVIGRTKGQKKSLPSGRFAIVLSVLTLILAVAVFALLFVWVYGVPGQVESQKEEIHRLAQMIQDQQHEIEELKEDNSVWANQAAGYRSGMPQPPAKSRAVCTMEKDAGRCMAAMPRWAFDERAGKCAQFVYGGCEGNGNNFITLHDCQETCEDHTHIEIIPILPKKAADDGEDDGTCALVPSAGPCRSQLPRFYFDAQDGACKKFLYGGCAGNTNNFVTEDECRGRCVLGASRQPKKIDNSKVHGKAACALEAEVGLCRAIIPRWFHDSASGECKEFSWGGCGGNDNNFSSRDKCEAMCLESSDDKAVQAKARKAGGDLDAVCMESMEVGLCRMAMPRFYFNAESGRCDHFIFGGCDGNGNNFETVEDCKERCERDPQPQPEPEVVR